jgi:hypothetical protein
MAAVVLRAGLRRHRRQTRENCGRGVGKGLRSVQRNAEREKMSYGKNTGSARYEEMFALQTLQNKD